MSESIGAGIVDDRRDALTGVHGWLLVFVIWTAVIAAAGILVGAAALGFGAVSEIDDVTAGLVLGVGVLCLLDVVLIYLRRKAAKLLSIFLFGVIALASAAIAAAIIARFIPGTMKEAAESARDGIVASLWLGYFLRSRRVDYTLTR